MMSLIMQFLNVRVLVLVSLLITNFTPCSSVSIANFEQANAGWIDVFESLIMNDFICFLQIFCFSSATSPRTNCVELSLPIVYLTFSLILTELNKKDF